jgi:hypothetical protein
VAIKVGEAKDLVNRQCFNIINISSLPTAQQKTTH